MVIVDAENGIYYTHRMEYGWNTNKELFDRYIGSDRVYGLHGFMGEPGYGHGFDSGSGPLGFGY